ncbi:hypothetical protein HK102_008272 [Quaeritorhiza haematococci]|nr:hypothetical protein HK102_008272 [Quaeritorhiza haematococci]
MPVLFVTRHGERQDWLTKPANGTPASSNPGTPTISTATLVKDDGNDEGRAVEDAVVNAATPSLADSPRLESNRTNDPYLSRFGVQQARAMGRHFKRKLATMPELQQQASKDRRPLTILCSPYLRCIQTALAVIEALQSLDDDNSLIKFLGVPKICLEYGLRELYEPGHTRSSYPVALDELKDYLPQALEHIDASYDSIVPLPPKPKQTFPPGDVVSNIKTVPTTMPFFETYEKLCERMRVLSGGLREKLGSSGPILLVSHAAAKIAFVRTFLEGGTEVVDGDEEAKDPLPQLNNKHVPCGVCSLTTLNIDPKHTDGTSPDFSWKYLYETDYLPTGEQKSWQFPRDR